jgi:hypothetical protein
MPTTYQGFDVLEIEPSAVASREFTHRRNLARLDSRTGKLRARDRSGVAVVKPGGFVWLLDGRTEIQAYRDFIAARRGALVPVWVPTWNRDLEMDTDLAAGNVNLSISKIGYTKFMFTTVARRHIAFLLADGTRYYRKIIGASESSSNEVLTLDSSIGVPIPKATMVAFLTLCRLAVDDPELTWHNRDVAEAVLDFVELPKEVPA